MAVSKRVYGVGRLNKLPFELMRRFTDELDRAFEGCFRARGALIALIYYRSCELEE
jgi:hypothetical protein